MNVEQKSAHVAHSGSMDGRLGKSKATGASNSAVADAGGFMSLLMSLGASDGQTPTALTGLGDALTGDGQMADALLPGMDAASVQQGADAAQLLQQQGLIPTQAQQGADAAQLLPQQGLIPMQEQQGPTITAAVPQGTSELGQVGAVPSAKTSAINGLVQSAEPGGAETGWIAAAAAKKAGAAASRAAAALSAQSSGQEPASTGRQDVADMLGHGKDGMVTRALETATSAALAELVVASAPGGEPVRQAARQTDRRDGPSTGAVGEGGLGASAFQVGGQPMDVQTASASVSGASPEASIAEQVHYWISNDVQNAELKLDNWGQSPVEVSISLQGNEARVEFRTDVPELRQILEEASAQLKEMLQGEGLVLSGVSVGSSGAGGAGAREPSPRSDVRRATVALPETAAVARPVRTGSSSGRSVDVFV